MRLDTAADAVTLEWAGNGLEAVRRLAIEGGALVVETTWRATVRPVPMVWVEHLTVGIQLLSPEVEIRLPGGRAFELSEVDGPAWPPAAAPAWPDMLLLDGSVERADRWPLDRPRARFGCVADLPDGRVEVRNVATGQGLLVEWDVDRAPAPLALARGADERRPVEGPGRDARPGAGLACRTRWVSLGRLPRARRIGSSRAPI